MDITINLSAFSKSKEFLDENIVYDLLVLGGGPAALNAALYATRKKLKLGLLTDDIGGQIAQSASIENWLGDPELKCSVLVNRFFDHVQKYQIPVKKGIKVTSLMHDSFLKIVTCSDGTKYQSKAIIIATGKSPRKLNIPGETDFLGRGVAYCTTCDGPAFQDKKVVVVGGGNSGVEAALDMLGYAKEVIIVQNIDKLTADPVLVDKIIQDKRVSVVYSSVCVRVNGQNHVEELVVKNINTNEEQVIDTDGIFVEIGLIPASEFVSDSIKNIQGEIEINSLCVTKIPGIFAAGDVTDVPYKQVIIAAGEGAKAALSVYNYLISN